MFICSTYMLQLCLSMTIMLWTFVHICLPLAIAGCVLHCTLPLRYPGGSFCPRSHPTWSFRWHHLLPKTRLVQTWGSAGITFGFLTLFVLHCFSIIVHQHKTNDCEHSVFRRCGSMPALRFFSPMPLDLVP